MGMLTRALRAPYSAVRNLGWSLQDRRVGVDTAVEIVDDRRSEPAGWWALRRFLREEEVGPDDVFIDYGSGKGRILIQAGHYPFRRIVGVEIAPGLNRIARANLDRVRPSLRCQEVELITADANDFVPPDDVTVAFFYNPFHRPTLAHALDELVASIRRRPRTLRLVYRLPMHEDLLAERGFRLVRSRRGILPWSRKYMTRLYALEPAGPAEG